MVNRAANLLRDIERGLGDGARTTLLLQQCILMGGLAGSRKLRDWAAQELNGYASARVTPVYRHVEAPICLSAIVGSTNITGQQIDSIALPDFAREAGIDENVRLHQGLGELEELADRDQRSVQFTLPGASTIARALDRASGRGPLQQTHAVYWNVSTASIRGVVEKVRTALAELVGELLDHLPDVDENPSKEALDNAVTFILSGERSTVYYADNGSPTVTHIEGDLVGDQFSDISGSTIINRSLVSNSMNALQSDGREEDAQALRQLADLVEQSENREAAEYLDAFNEELSKPEPRKTILRSMWDGIVRVLPYVANVAAISTGIGNIVS